MDRTDLCDYTGFEDFPHMQVDPLCEYAPFCETYEKAQQVSDERKPAGDLEEATLQIDDICRNKAVRVGESCYRKFQKTDVDAFMPLEIDFIPDTETTIPWDPELPRPPENTRIALRGHSRGFTAVDKTTGKSFNLIHNDKTNQHSWIPLGVGEK